MKIIRLVAFAFLLLFLGQSCAYANALPQDNTKAVILAYHRIGEDHIPDENLTLENFQSHVAEIQNGNYNVLSLPELMAALESNTPLPPKTIVMTFEGAYRSAMQNAAPLLLEANIPFTVFYAADMLDQNNPEFTNWETLKDLAKNRRVTLGTLPSTYAHIVYEPQNRLIGLLNKARQRHREEFKQETDYLAYPFGEYSDALKTLAQSKGFKAAFGLHSGVIYAGADLFSIPRFSMTDSYGNLERFQLVTRAYPLPVSDMEPTDPALGDKAFSAGFTISNALLQNAKDLSCFISGESTPELQILDNRIEIRPAQNAKNLDRMRLNCTMPGPTIDDEMQWRWLGFLFHRKPVIPEPQTAEISNPEPGEPQ